MAKREQETSRERRKRTPKPIVVIVCEGSKTELTYFRHFRNRYVNIRIEVEGNKSTGNKTDFNHLIKKSVSKKKEYITDTEGEGYVWRVFDADVDYNTPNAMPTKNEQLQKAVKEAADNGISIALSNPCFELWFLMHLGFTTSPMKNYDDIKKKLIVHLPDYEKNADVYDELTDKPAFYKALRELYAVGVRRSRWGDRCCAALLEPAFCDGYPAGQGCIKRYRSLVIEMGYGCPTELPALYNKTRI